MNPITFRTLEEIAQAATPENHTRLGMDLYAWLQMVTAMKIVNPKARCVAMEWKDDGEHTCTGSIMHTTKAKKKARKR